MPTPLILEKKLFVLGNNGLLTCYDLASGKQLQRQRLSDATSNAYTASPIAIGGQIYCISEQGVTAITSTTDSGPILARNSLGEPVLATPAVAKGTLLIRGEKHLFAIAK
jgi:outer membrane protein assembly factor BamB